MGTRALTVVQNFEGKDLVVLYRQFDGYLEGHGQELAEFLGEMKIVNGIGRETPPIANGMECLAAQIVARFKDGAGGFYLQPSGTRDAGADYIYYLTSVDDPLKLGVAGHTTVHIKVTTRNSEVVFEGTPEELLIAAKGETDG